METLGLIHQTAFLLALGQGNQFADLYYDGMDETDRVRARLQLKTLIYPKAWASASRSSSNKNSSPTPN